MIRYEIWSNWVDDWAENMTEPYSLEFISLTDALLYASLLYELKAPAQSISVACRLSNNNST